MPCSGVTLTIGHDGTRAPGDDWTNQSDQGAFSAGGIPFVYFGEEDHPDYHRATDHADRLMPNFYAVLFAPSATSSCDSISNPYPGDDQIRAELMAV